MVLAFQKHEFHKINLNSVNSYCFKMAIFVIWMLGNLKWLILHRKSYFKKPNYLKKKKNPS